MKSVWKYIVYVNDFPQPLEIPAGARVVHVASQRPTPDVVTFWAEVDIDAGQETRWFQVFGTGHQVPDDAQYVGSTMPVPELVWHLFELEKAPKPVEVPA